MFNIDLKFDKHIISHSFLHVLVKFHRKQSFRSKVMIKKPSLSPKKRVLNFVIFWLFFCHNFWQECSIFETKRVPECWGRQQYRFKIKNPIFKVLVIGRIRFRGTFSIFDPPQTNSKIILIFIYYFMLARRLTSS